MEKHVSLPTVLTLREEMGSKTRWLAEEATLVLLVSSVHRVETIKGRLRNLWPTQTRTYAHTYTREHTCTHSKHMFSKEKIQFTHSVDLLF